MAKEVLVRISADGSEAEVDGKGFQGRSCVDFIGNIVKGLGEITDEKKKPEFYLGPKQQVGSR